MQTCPAGRPGCSPAPPALGGVPAGHSRITQGLQGWPAAGVLVEAGGVETSPLLPNPWRPFPDRSHLPRRRPRPQPPSPETSVGPGEAVLSSPAARAWPRGSARHGAVAASVTADTHRITQDTPSVEKKCFPFSILHGAPQGHARPGCSVPGMSHPPRIRVLDRGDVLSGQPHKSRSDFSARGAFARSFEAKTRRIKRSDSFLRLSAVKHQRSRKTKIYSASADSSVAQPRKNQEKRNIWPEKHTCLRKKKKG